LLLNYSTCDANKCGISGYTPLHTAAAHGESSIIQTLLSLPTMAIDAQDKDGNTPLHKAVLYKRLSAVKYLVSQGANCTISNNEGITPAQLAQKQVGWLDWLLDKDRRSIWIITNSKTAQ
jgi:ankyrin repeat protein